MQIKRTETEWVVRWVVRQPDATTLAAHDAPSGGCAFCDDDVEWIVLRDFVPMPRASGVGQCDRCGSVTATAALPVVSRRPKQPQSDATTTAGARAQPT